MRLKYILDKYGNFAIFTEANTHVDMAKGFYQKPISAGFCYLAGLIPTQKGANDIHVHCFGESVSLGLKSRPEDGQIITNKIHRGDY